MSCHVMPSSQITSKITAAAPINSSNYNEAIRGLCLKLGSCHSPIKEKTVGWRSRALHPFQPMAGFTTMELWRMVWDGSRPMTFAQFVWKKRGLASDGSGWEIQCDVFFSFSQGWNLGSRRCNPNHVATKGTKDRLEPLPTLETMTWLYIAHMEASKTHKRGAKIDSCWFRLWLNWLSNRIEKNGQQLRDLRFHLQLGHNAVPNLFRWYATMFVRSPPVPVIVGCE